MLTGKRPAKGIMASKAPGYPTALLYRVISSSAAVKAFSDAAEYKSSRLALMSVRRARPITLTA